MSSAVNIHNISKTFGNNKALHRVSLKISKGEMVSLIGASGSGKSTLLRHISGLINSDTNDSSIKVNSDTVMKNGKISRNIRKIRSNVGFVFQKFNLVGRLPVLKNVLIGNLTHMPLWRRVMQYFFNNEKMYALETLARVKMAKYVSQKASTLSGGQQQRVAIARCLMQKSKIILADEPIASLDPESSKQVMKSLANINKEDGVTVIVSLHQVDYAVKYCKRIIALKDGELVFDGKSSELTGKLLDKIYDGKYNENENYRFQNDAVKKDDAMAQLKAYL